MVDPWVTNPQPVCIGLHLWFGLVSRGYEVLAGVVIAVQSVLLVRELMGWGKESKEYVIKIMAFVGSGAYPQSTSRFIVWMLTYRMSATSNRTLRSLSAGNQDESLWLERDQG